MYGGGGAIGGAVARADAAPGRRGLEDVGHVAAFAASDRARTMTGATVNVSAGR